MESGHDASEFDCGRPVLDDWLRRKALANQASGVSRTFVVCEKGKIVAYYCLANGSVSRRDAPGKIKRNMPEPVPVMVLGRLAVHRAMQGRGLGAALLRDAVLRTLTAADLAGMRAILVHALDEDAALFYRKHGFPESPMNPLVLMLPMEAARRALIRAGESG